jgi:DNA-binding MarR family transcriptional regulator
MKPVFLMPQLWQKQVALEVKIDRGDSSILRELRKVHAVMASKALSSAFFLIASGVRNPGEIARRMGRTKYSVSLQISKLRESGLIVPLARSGSDLRRRNYEISTKKLLQIFKRDFSFELDLYENQLLSQSSGEVRGSIDKVELAVLGGGRVGLIREITPDRPLKRNPEAERVRRKLESCDYEFLALFRTFLRERRFGTLLEYFLAFYRELSMSHRKLPRESELGQFFEFVDTSITRLKPIEELWKTSMSNASALPTTRATSPSSPSLESIKVFSEAGRMDSSGRYILNADSRAYLKPGVRVKIYPSYTFMEQERRARIR